MTPTVSKPFKQDALPVAGDRVALHQVEHVLVLLLDQPAQPQFRDVEPPGGRDDVRRVADRGHQFPVFQVCHNVVHRAVGGVGDGGQLQPVEERHRRQVLQGSQVSLHMIRTSPTGATPTAGLPPFAAERGHRSRCEG